MKQWNQIRFKSYEDLQKLIVEAWVDQSKVSDLAFILALHLSYVNELKAKECLTRDELLFLLYWNSADQWLHSGFNDAA